MNRMRNSVVLIIASAFLIVTFSCQRKTRNRLDESHFPPVVLWAWERPEDLRGLDANRFAVAFLAQTLVLKGDDLVFNPRRQPLQVSPDTKMMAVTRIESSKVTGERAALSEAQKQKLVSLVIKTAQLGNVSAIQIDFDAASSERDFYKSLLQNLRAQLPDKMPLSMTALASFCIGDRWLRDLPVDEAVPMIFRMGADDRSIENALAGGDDFREPLCRQSYGVAIDEPLEMKRDPTRRLYVFNNRSWTQNDIATLREK
jgi:Protein of unknown function (DUF3142)